MRVALDKQAMKQLFELICPTDIDSNEMKMVRLGKPSIDKLRPLKVIFRGVEDARIFLDNFQLTVSRILKILRGWV